MCCHDGGDRHGREFGSVSSSSKSWRLRERRFVCSKRERTSSEVSKATEGERRCSRPSAVCGAAGSERVGTVSVGGSGLS